jgi:hypothetical protein
MTFNLSELILVKSENTRCGLFIFQTTVVVKRKWPPGLGKGDEFARLKSRHYIYEVVENKLDVKHPDVRVILAENVEGL